MRVWLMVQLWAGLGSLVLTAALLFGAAGAVASSEAMKALGILELRERTPAPNVTLPTLDGRPFSLADLRGKVVLVNFWATWCVLCQWEMPLMEKLYQAYKARGFVVVAISLDREGVAVVKPFVQEKKLTYPVLLDTSRQGAKQFGLVGVPATFLVGPDGLSKGITYGPKEWNGAEARAVIESLLRQMSDKKGGGCCCC